MDADDIKAEIERIFTEWKPRGRATEEEINRLVDSIETNIILWAQVNADSIDVEIIPEEKRIEFTFTADLSGLVIPED
jgi:hypothetical protein